MKLFVAPEIDAYCEAHTRERPALLEELRAYTYANVKSPQMQVGKVEGGLLKLLCALCSARRVLEVGTFTGYSALCMAEALPDDGEIITCDLDAEVMKIAQSFFDRSPHGKKIRVRLGPARETIHRLDGRPFDVAFLDADKAAYPDYFELVLPHLRRGGLLVADNVLWSGEVLDPREPDALGLARFNELVQSDERVENVMLPVRDGVMLARKR